MFKEVMLVHESVSADLAGELWQLAALDAFVLEQGLLPLVGLAAALAEEPPQLVHFRPRPGLLSTLTRPPSRTCEPRKQNRLKHRF